MSPRIAAEWTWLRGRLPLRAAGALALAVTATQLVVRAVGSQRDVAGAVRRAQAEVARSAGLGVDLPLESVYVEPRYLLAARAPADLGSVAVALLVVGLVAAALAVGGEWRTGTVRLAFPTPDARPGATVLRVGAWWAAWTAVALSCLALAAAGLWLVAATRGDTTGTAVAPVVGIVLRGTLVAGVGAGVGAGLAATLRSDVAVLVGTLAYVLVGEMLLPAVQPGFRSPGLRVVDLVVAQDVAGGPVLACGAPSCPEVVLSGAGSAAGFGAVLAALVVAGGLAWWSARRPVWR